MTKKKDVSRKVVNKKTRKVSNKVRGDECPDNVCPINKKKKKNNGSKCCSKAQKASEVSTNYFVSFLDFIFPSRKKNR